MEEIKILSDNPEEQNEKIKFDFHAYKQTFVDIIEGCQNETPLVIGLEGKWGRGKTTLMKAIRTQLQTKGEGRTGKGKRRCKTVWFQAWKYNDADNLLAALLENIVREMGKGSFFEKAEINIMKAWEKLNLKAIPEFFSGYVPFLKGIPKIIKEEEYKKNLPYFDLFSSFLKQLIRLWIHAEGSFKLKETNDFEIGDINDKEGVLVVFIDDLDRCNSQNIVKVIEAIKLFLDFKGCVFVMGVSRDVIIKALRESPHIGEEYANEYLEKIIQVSYELPLIHEDDMGNYFREIVHQFEYGEILSKYSNMIVKPLGETPRKIKKFINNLNLQIKIADYKELFDKKGLEIKDYIYWNVLKEAFKETHDAIKINPKIPSMVKEEFKKHEQDINNEKFENIDKMPYEPVKKVLRQPDLINIILNLPDKHETIETLIYESTAVGMNKITVDIELSALKIDAYSTGQMVKIEKGHFLYGDEKKKKNIDYDYEMDVFPVTNAGYCLFINKKRPDEELLNKWINLEGSYGNEKCRIRKGKDEYYVENGYEAHPVIYVSRYGANEYAKFANKRLPTEEEWEKAARGPNGWSYPWGDKFDKTLCNTVEIGIGGTTGVDKYPKGKSYYGCYDMAGNVWEWTGSKYDVDSYVLRGGSWGNNGSFNCRCACRGRGNPVYGYYAMWDFVAPGLLHFSSFTLLHFDVVGGLCERNRRGAAKIVYCIWLTLARGG